MPFLALSPGFPGRIAGPAAVPTYLPGPWQAFVMIHLSVLNARDPSVCQARLASYEPAPGQIAKRDAVLKDGRPSGTSPAQCREWTSYRAYDWRQRDDADYCEIRMLHGVLAML